MERLQKLLAAAGVASRRGAEELIRAGRVTVNGKTATLGQQAETESDVVCVDGRPVRRLAARTYVAMNKPAGYACTKRDPHLPHTVYDLLPPSLAGVVTVGRLDVDTEGLLLLTDDGDWANAIAHPSQHVPKTYVADVQGRAEPDDLDALRRGIRLEDGWTLPAKARRLSYFASEGITRLEVVISEGRKRQVRRMLAALGLPVLRLERVAIGPLQLGELPLGRWRKLTEEEVASLAPGEAE